MEQLKVITRYENESSFQEVCKKEFGKSLNELPLDGGDLRILCLKGATEGGDPGLLLSFTSLIDGKLIRVQTTTTLKLFLFAAKALEERYRRNE